MRKLFFNFATFVLFAGHLLGDPVALQHFENSTSGTALTTNILTAGLLRSGTAPGPGYWTAVNITDGGSLITNMQVNTSAEQAGFLRPIIIGGTTNDDAGSTRGIRVTYKEVKRRYAEFVFNTNNITKLTLGAYVKLGPAGSWSGATFNSYDLTRILIDSGDYLVMNLWDNTGPGPHLQVHTTLHKGSDSGTTNVYNPTRNKFYWVAMKCDLTTGANGRADIWFYDPVTWTRVATSTLSLDVSSPGTKKITHFAFGDFEDHGVANSTNYVEFDDIVWDTTGARWPIMPASITQLAVTGSSADYDTAYTAAGTGDHLLIPAGSNLWTSTKTLAKKIYIAGLGGTNYNGTVINWDVAAQTDDGFYGTSGFSGGAITNMMLRAVSNECRLVHLEGANDVLLHGLFLQNAFWGIYSEGRTTAHRCFIYNCEKAIRNHGWLADSTMWSTYYPVGNSSTNRSVYEYCYLKYDSSAPPAPVPAVQHNMCSSQNAASWCLRHTTIEVLAAQWSPIIDSHGDDSSVAFRGVMSDQMYKCDFIVGGSATISGNLDDKRGGRGLCFSNTLSGTISTVRLREERETDVPNDRVEEYYCYDNSPEITTTIGSGNEDFIILDQHYFLHSPTGDAVLTTPSYRVTGLAPGAQLLEPLSPSDAISATTGAGGRSVLNRNQSAASP